VALVLLAAVACAHGGDAPASGTRVVSLTPSATEVVAALGATSTLVGVDDFSKYPPEVEKLPKVGSFMQPNTEVIVRLHPTLVIVDDIHATTARALADAGIATVACPMHDLANVRECLRVVGAKLGKTREADTARAAIDSAITSARAHPLARQRVLAVIDRSAGDLGNAVAAGPGSWVGELLDAVGVDNAIAESRYVKVSLETMLRAQPDVILDLSGQDIAAWNAIDVPAVRNHRVFALDEKTLQGPGPRVQVAIEALYRSLSSR
jgi:iron complex transport system substrate-binding protein